jgi:hypothetical protein
MLICLEDLIAIREEFAKSTIDRSMHFVWFSILQNKSQTPEISVQALRRIPVNED